MTEQEEAKFELYKWLLEDAYKYLKAGKAQFAPNTTNSDVDHWLARYERLKKEGKL